jgi:hypothetical protein
MRTLIQCKSLYQDIEALSTLVSSMEYVQTPFGEQIKEFNYIPQGITEQFEQYVNEPVEIQADTGVFRKPSNFIHFEPFYQHALWLCIVALEDTTFKIHEQDSVKTMFDVENLEEFIPNNCTDDTKWHTVTQINMKQTEFIFVRPWMWYSLTEGKLVQVFLLNKNLTQVEE